MTHEEALELLPIHALGALEEETPALEAHLEVCALCRAELAACLETTAAMGGAVERIEPPVELRAAVLSRRTGGLSAAPRAPRRFFPWFRFSSPMPAALAVVAVVLGVAWWGSTRQAALRETRAKLALDERGLALLTSTETAVARLNPVPPAGAPAHGHWYHRPGIPTQVLVIEFMPKPAAGEQYFGWLQAGDGSWRAAGSFPLDPAGHGRLILTGDDGSRVREVRITRQARATAAPEGAIVLRWPAP